MSRLSRMILVGAVAGTAAVAAPSAQAYQQPYDCVTSPCYQCVIYPCGPGDWVEFVASKGGVTVEFQPMVVCVTYPCRQPTPVVVCVTDLGICTPR